MSIVDVRAAGRVVARFWGVARVLLWRVVVAAIGFLVAWQVGWRLSREDAILVVCCAWLPLALWCVVAPRLWWAIPIALALLALIGTVRWTLPGEPGDRSRPVALSVLMWYVLPGTAALLLGAFGIGRDRWLRRRQGPGAVRNAGCAVRVGGRYHGPQSPLSGPRAWEQDPTSDNPAPASRRTWPSRISVAAAVLTFMFGCCCPGGLLALFGNAAPGPSDAELFPLPPGMDATGGDGLDGPSGCDMTGHACWLSYRITGSPDHRPSRSRT